MVCPLLRLSANSKAHNALTLHPIYHPAQKLSPGLLRRFHLKRKTRKEEQIQEPKPQEELERARSQPNESPKAEPSKTKTKERILDNWLSSYLHFTRHEESPEMFHLWTGLCALATAVACGAAGGRANRWTGTPVPRLSGAPGPRSPRSFQAVTASGTGSFAGATGGFMSRARARPTTTKTAVTWKPNT